jgi:hypothetical protein
MRPDWKYYDLERPDDYQLITSDPLGFFSRQRENTIPDTSQISLARKIQSED